MKCSELTGDAFERLLEAFASGDRAAAGERYEAARWRLIKFFTWRGARDPESLADEAFTRVAAQMQRGDAIRDVDHYLHGVAQLIAREEEREQARRIPLPADLPESGVNQADEEALACLSKCLARLPAETQALLQRYYAGRGQARIAERRKLAGELGVSENALRNRTLRLRERLERCLNDCIERDVSRIRNTSEWEGQ